MSVYLRVYVGPLLKCSPKGACDVCSLTKGRLEAQDQTDWGPLDYDVVIPDQLDGSERQLRFSRHDNMTPVEVLSPDAEICVFRYEHEASIRMLRKHYTSVHVGWGVVTNYV